MTTTITLSAILLLAAFVLFVLAAVVPSQTAATTTPARFNLIAAGLASLALSLLLGGVHL